MSDFDAEEQRLADLFASVPAPDALRGRWVSERRPGAALRGGVGRRAGRALVAALIGSRGERRLRPLAAALVLPVAVLGVAGAVQLRAHFTTALAGTPGNPPARAQAAIAYDPAHGVVVMFGGRGESGALADTWTWDGSTWREQYPTVAPPARSGAAMGYDRRTGRLVLFGGLPVRGAENATWTWDGTTWRPEAPVHPPQGPAQAPMLAGMAADPATGQLVLVAPVPQALTAPPPPPAVIAAPAASARPLPPGAAPGPQGVPLPAPSPVITYTSDLQDYEFGTWTWTGSNWAAAAGARRPVGALAMPSIAYDSSIGKLMLLTASTPQCASASASASPGGATAPPAHGAGATASTVPCVASVPRPVRWTWDGSDWTKDASPMGKLGYPTLFASAADGWLSFQRGTTVTGAGTQVATRGDTPGLRYRSAPALAWDEARHEVVLFGGTFSSNRYGADTWVWDGKNWTHRAGPVEPIPTPRPSFPAQSPVPVTPARTPCSESVAAPTFTAVLSATGDVVQIAVTATALGCPGFAVAELVDQQGKGVQVSGSPRKLPLQGSATFEWRNWCGGPGVSLVLSGQAIKAEARPIGMTPTCVDRSQPSTLTPSPVPTH